MSMFSIHDGTWSLPLAIDWANSEFFTELTAAAASRSIQSVVMTPDARRLLRTVDNSFLNGSTVGVGVCVGIGVCGFRSGGVHFSEGRASECT